MLWIKQQISGETAESKLSAVKAGNRPSCLYLQLQLPGRCGDQGSENSPRVAFDLYLPYSGQCMSSLPYNRAALTIADHAESAGMVHARATAFISLKALHVRRHYGELPRNGRAMCIMIM